MHWMINILVSSVWRNQACCCMLIPLGMYNHLKPRTPKRLANDASQKILKCFFDAKNKNRLKNAPYINSINCRIPDIQWFNLQIKFYLGVSNKVVFCKDCQVIYSREYHITKKYRQKSTRYHIILKENFFQIVTKPYTTKLVAHRSHLSHCKAI